MTKLEIIITIHKDVVTKPVLPINPPSPRPRYLLHLHKAKPIPGGAKHHNGHHFSARLNPPLASYKKSWKDCNNTSIAFHPPRVLTSVVAPIIPPKTNTSIVLYCTVLRSRSSISVSSEPAQNAVPDTLSKDACTGNARGGSYSLLNVIAPKRAAY